MLMTQALIPHSGGLRAKLRLLQRAAHLNGWQITELEVDLSRRSVSIEVTRGSVHSGDKRVLWLKGSVDAPMLQADRVFFRQHRTGRRGDINVVSRLHTELFYRWPTQHLNEQLKSLAAFMWDNPAPAIAEARAAALIAEAAEGEEWAEVRKGLVIDLHPWSDDDDSEGEE